VAVDGSRASAVRERDAWRRSCVVERFTRLLNVVLDYELIGTDERLPGWWLMPQTSAGGPGKNFLSERIALLPVGACAERDRRVRRPRFVVSATRGGDDASSSGSRDC
jgi:hypothetical protein